VTEDATVGTDARLRLFCGLRLPDDVLERLVSWQTEHVPEGRVVSREKLHITLAFLGSRPRDDLEGIVEVLRAAAGSAEPIRLEVDRYREGRSVGMLVLDDPRGAAARLAEDVQRRLESLGVYRREARDWLPHLTVVRFRNRPRLDPPLPDLGPIVPSEAAVYLSRLRRSGAEYVVLESVALGGN
jgi:2'-5' RNA ligase